MQNSTNVDKQGRYCWFTSDVLRKTNVSIILPSSLQARYRRLRWHRRLEASVMRPWQAGQLQKSAPGACLSQLLLLNGGIAVPALGDGSLKDSLEGCQAAKQSRVDKVHHGCIGSSHHLTRDIKTLKDGSYACQAHVARYASCGVTALIDMSWQ